MRQLPSHFTEEETKGAEKLNDLPKFIQDSNSAPFQSPHSQTLSHVGNGKVCFSLALLETHPICR